MPVGVQLQNSIAPGSYTGRMQVRGCSAAEDLPVVVARVSAPSFEGMVTRCPRLVQRHQHKSTVKVDGAGKSVSR